MSTQLPILNSNTGLNEKRIRYFYAIMQVGSMRQAADQLDVEQSVISRQIQQLEIDLSVSLFERKANRLVPTEAAWLMMTHVKERFAQEEALIYALSELNEARRGRVHLVSGEGFVPYLVNNVLTKFYAQRPNVDFALILLSMNELVRHIVEDKAHIGLAYIANLPPEIEVLAEKHEPVCVICAKDHPLASLPQPISLRETLPYSVAIMPSGYGFRQMVDAAELHEKIKFKRGLITNSVRALKHFAASGLGISFMRQDDALSEEMADKLVAIRTTCPILESAKAQLIVHKGRLLPAAALELIDVLINSKIFQKTED